MDFIYKKGGCQLKSSIEMNTWGGKIIDLSGDKS